MKGLKILITMVLSLAFALTAWAHFGVIIPSDDIVSMKDNKKVTLGIKFMHPFEQNYMNMAKPKVLGVMIDGKRHDLLPALKEKMVKGFSTWEATYMIKGPGDHVFYVEPETDYSVLAGITGRF